MAHYLNENENRLTNIFKGTCLKHFGCDSFSAIVHVFIVYVVCKLNVMFLKDSCVTRTGYLSPITHMLMTHRRETITLHSLHYHVRH